jgi:hypothetical protein
MLAVRESEPALPMLRARATPRRGSRTDPVAPAFVLR